MFLSLNSQQQHALDAGRASIWTNVGRFIKIFYSTIVNLSYIYLIALFTLMRISTSKVLKGIARVYVSIIRGTPMIAVIHNLLWYS